MHDFSLKITTKVCDFYSTFFYIRWNKILQKVPATRIMFLPQKEIVCKSLGATGRNFLSFEEISCHRKKIPVTGRNFLTQDESCCHRKKFALTAKNTCHRKTFSVTGNNFRQCTSPLPPLHYICNVLH